MGQQLGIAPSITMQNVANTLGITKSAMDSGAFSNNVFGTMNKEQFQNQTLQTLQETEASGNSKALAALNRIYKMDPKKFAGTELAAAMEKYNDANSDGTYTDPATGKKKNLYELIGRGRHFAAMDILQNSGGSENDFYSSVNSPLTQQFANAGKASLTRKHEVMQLLNEFGGQSSFEAALAGTDTLKNMTPEEIAAASEAATSMAIDTAASKSPGDQITYMQNNLERKFYENLKTTRDPATAAKMAKEMAQKFAGDRSTLNRFLGNLDTAVADAGLGNTASLSQSVGENRDVYGLLNAGNAAKRAEAQRRAVGYETTIGQRASDYFLSIGKNNEKFNLSEFMKELAPVIGDEKVLEMFGGKMGAGMHSLSRMRDKHQVTEKDISDLAGKAAKGNTAEAQLRKLGKVDANTEVLYQAEIDAAKQTEINKLSETAKDGEESELDKEYKAILGPDADMTISAERKREALRESTTYSSRFEEKYLQQRQADGGGKNFITQRQLQSAAMSESLGALSEKAGASEKELNAIKSMQRSLEQGDNDEVVRAGLDAFFNADSFQSVTGKLDKKARNELKEAVMNKDDSTEMILKTLGIDAETFEKDKSKKFEDKSEQQIAAEYLVAADTGRGNPLSAMGGPSAAGDATAKQKVEKAQIDATTVVINADNVSGGAAAATVQAPGSALPTSAEGVDAELASIEEKRKSRAGMGGALTNEESNRKAELEQQREKLAQKTTEAKSGPEQKGATTPDGKAATTAAAAEGAYSSANITPASLNQPQQQGTTVLASTGGGGSGGATNVVGTLTINNLREGVLALMNEGGGVPPAGNGPTVFNGNSTTTA